MNDTTDDKKHSQSDQKADAIALVCLVFIVVAAVSFWVSHQ